MRPSYKARVMTVGEDMADLIVHSEYGPAWDTILIMEDIIERSRGKKFFKTARITITEVENNGI